MDVIIKEVFDFMKLVQLLSVISKSRACNWENLIDHVVARLYLLMDTSVTFLLFQDSDFEAPCYIAPSLRILVPRSFLAYYHFLLSEGIVLLRLWPLLRMAPQGQRPLFLSFHSGLRPAAITCRMSPTSPSYSCSLHMAVRTTRSGAVGGVTSIVCFSHRAAFRLPNRQFPWGLNRPPRPAYFSSASCLGSRTS
jgi:hypothetical protein